MAWNYDAQNHDKTVFNMDLAYLQRLDRLLYLASMAAIKFDFETWFSSLKAIHRQISPKLKKYKITKDGKEIEIDEPKAMSEMLQKIYIVRKDFMLPNHPDHNKFGSIYFNKLEELEMKLLELMRKYGLIFMDMEDPRHSLRLE